MTLNTLHLDEEFYQACQDMAFKFTPYDFRASINSTGNGDEDDAFDPSRLTDHSPAAYKDFYGLPSGAPCIFKSGPAWPERTGPMEHRIIREARPAYDHPIANSWLEIGTDIHRFLDSRNVRWTSIDPVAFANANAEDDTPFCPLLVWIGVQPKTLAFEDAVTAANGVKSILSQAGFPDIEVAFRESEVTRSAGPELLPFAPLLDFIPEFRKHFTPTLSLSIAPYKTPYHEGSGALYFRLDKDGSRVALLTAGHVARPPVRAKMDNSGSRKNAGKRREEIVVLGSMGYQNTTVGMIWLPSTTSAAPLGYGRTRSLG